MTSSENAAPPAPKGVDIERPAASRIYDWYLGGKTNYAIDREFGKRAEVTFPLIKPLAQGNRWWMNRVVQAAADAGIRQIIDLGSGVPSVGNAHTVLRGALPNGEKSSVLYVDYEDVAAAHARVALEQDDATGWAGVVQQDLRNERKILDDPETRRLIDFDQPVCLLFVAVLHFLGPQDRPEDVVQRYAKRLAPGSWVAISHITCDDDAPTESAEMVRRFVASYRDTTNPLWLRSRDEMRHLFPAGWPLLEPGLVHPPNWRPDGGTLLAEDDKAGVFGWCGVAEKPR
jgi:hypothetical protein